MKEPQSAKKYLELTTKEKTALFIKGLLFLYVEKLLEQKGTIKQSQADILIKSFTDEIVKSFETPLSQKDIEKIVAKIERELEKC